MSGSAGSAIRSLGYQTSIPDRCSDRNVDDPGSRDLEARFDTFFATEGRMLVGMEYLLTGDLAEALDLTQETLVRVWERWDRVSGYDKP